MTGRKLRLTVRIDLENAARLGPGKVQLLQLIGEHGSIRAAGAAMGMSYRRAWLLADEINRMFREESVFTRHGGKSGGGAGLTEFGMTLLDCARRIDEKTQAAIAEELVWLMAKTNPAFRSAAEQNED